MKHPWSKFYWADWRSDPRLRMCGLAARGLWIEMLALMNEATPFGHLLVNGRPPTDAQLAVLVGAPQEQIPDLLGELETSGVFSRTQKGTIYSRRMTRDDKRARVASNDGDRGGNPNIDRGSVPKAERVRWNRQSNPTKVNAVWEQSGGKCHWCNIDLTRDNVNAPTAFEIDHMNPLRHGGTNDLGNLVASCKQCNFQRASKDVSNQRPNTQRLEARDQRLESKKDPPASLPPEGDEPKKARGYRLPSDFKVSAEWVSEGEELRRQRGLPPADLDTEAIAFPLYWTAVPGAKGTKMDWRKTWLNRCLQIKGSTNGHANGRTDGSGGIPPIQPIQPSGPRSPPPRYILPPQ